MGAVGVASAQSSVCEVPFDFHRTRMILVKARIGDLDNQTILVDTGAYLTLIDHHVRQRLHLGYEGHIIIADSSRVTNLQTVTVPQLQFGHVVFRSFRAVDVDLSHLSRTIGIEVDAAIGLELLGQGSVTIDFVHSKLQLLGMGNACSAVDVHANTIAKGGPAAQ